MDKLLIEAIGDRAKPRATIQGGFSAPLEDLQFYNTQAGARPPTRVAEKVVHTTNPAFQYGLTKPLD